MRLIADNLAAARGGEPVFEGLSFTLEEGRALIVTGANGSGKSTLLRVLANLLDPLEGSMRLEGGNDAWSDAAAASHYLGHDNAMKPALTVRENLDFWRKFLAEPHLPVRVALEMVGLPDIGHLPYGVLSTGQRRRIAICRLLVSYRPIWLLDEPTSGLDKASERQFSELMQAHREDGGLIVAATHLPLGLAGVKELKMGDFAA